MRSPAKHQEERRTTARRGPTTDRRTEVVRGALGDRRLVEQRGVADAMCDALEDILHWERASEVHLKVRRPAN
ncbi:MAG: hypothetical protein KC657_21005 [Myxococcales bacterium]|nr:hypothetical protein [Myxococcales bacterium]